MKARFILVALVAFLSRPSLDLCPRAAGAEEVKAANLDPALPYQARLGNPVTYEVDFTVVVTAPSHTKLLKVWLPLAPSDAAQKVTEKDLTTFPAEVKPRIAAEKTFGNRFAYFEFPKPQGAQIIRHRFTVAVSEMHWDLDPEKVVNVKSWPRAFDPYLLSDRSVVVDDRLRVALAQAVPKSRGSIRDLAEAMAWVNGHLQYDHDNASLRASSEHALTTGKGHCSDYHGLCAAFGRALGYPTRITYGINPFPKNSPSHCKVEVYLPPYGWVSFDVSETQNLIGAISKDARLGTTEKDALVKAATRRLRSGFRDNTWYLQTRGTDYDLAPPAARRVPVVRTLYAEADGVALPDPDPADGTKREYAWMTSHRYTPDREVKYPFKDWTDLSGRR